MSLRARLVAVALSVVALTLLAAGTGIYLLTGRGVNSSLDAAARASAEQVATLLRSGQLPDALPAPAGQLIQVLDVENRVLAGSLTADRLSPLILASERAALRSGGVIVVDGSRAALSGSLRVMGQEVATSDGTKLVVVAVPTTDAEAGRGVLGRRLLLMLPLLVLFLGLVFWRMIGSALAPVEALRRGAERIGAEQMVASHRSDPEQASGESARPQRLPVPTTHDEVHALAVTLNDMLDRLAASRAKQRAFVADAAHELRSPLAAIRTDLEVSQRLGEGGQVPARLLPEIERLSTLVDDLLTLARSQDSPAATAQQVDLEAFAHRVIDRYGQSRVPVRLADTMLADTMLADTGQPPPVVAVVEADLLRAVTNLVDNAVRHAKSQVLLAITMESSQVCLSVSDDGAGIAPDQRERVFDRFARLDDARDRDRGGSGLGLSIARELLRRNGADLTLEDAEPGVRAVVTLPQGMSNER